MTTQRVLFSIAVMAATAVSAFAQNSREEWVQMRESRLARQALAPAATVTGGLSITMIRFYADSSGRLVGVGEARNNSGRALSYSRLEFAFYNNSGGLIGAELTYLFGGLRGRILANQLYENVLLPGDVGFFKVWAAIQASSMATFTVTAAGEDLQYVAPLASSFPRPGPPPSWLSHVFVASTPSITGQRVSGTVINDDPLTPGCPCGHPSFLAHSLRVAVAVYQDGVIADVKSAPAVGPRSVTTCGGVSTTGIMLHESAIFTFEVDRPANQVARSSVEWEEIGIHPTPVIVPAEGGMASFTFAGQCSWTARSQESWITVTRGASSVSMAGDVAISVQANPTTQARTGTVLVPGGTVPVLQAAPCRFTLSQTELFLGAGRVNFSQPISVESNCTWTPEPTASWLTATRSGDAFTVSLQPNLTGATRRAVVHVGDAALTVQQRAVSGSGSDLNGDGWLDLLWHHAFDGSVAVWLMRGTSVIDGTLLSPSAVADINWRPVGVGDLDGDGSSDIAWQNYADGRISYWAMAGTSLLRGELLSPDRVADTGWKIRALADINRDGRTDLVWRHDVSGQLAVWFMRYQASTPTLISGDTLGPGHVADLDWALVGASDFNRDGHADLLWQHQVDGRIGVWKMQGTTLADGHLITPAQVPDLNWKIRAVGDINGDDMPDLIWRNRVTGDVSVWLMNGTTLVSGVVVRNVPDVNWEIVGPR
jgi:hypothetical protein